MSGFTFVFRWFAGLFALFILLLPALPRVPGNLSEPDRIHFLKVGTSDAILLESDGHFAMVDAGEDTDNPRGFANLELEGHEEEVLAYLKEHAAGKDGKVHLDFVLGTHAHSDHIGGFDTVILDPDVEVGRAYLKEYDSSKINERELLEWDNQEVYDQMVDALNKRNVPVISEPDGTPFAFGNFTVTLFNTDDPENTERVGENDMSMGVLLEKNGTKIFLAGDMDDYTGDETRLAPEIGRVNLLKLGHHGYDGSTTQGFVETLRPDYCVVTNSRNFGLMKKFEMIIKTCGHNRIYVTGVENGVLAVIGDGGKIDFYGQIQKLESPPAAPDGRGF